MTLIQGGQNFLKKRIKNANVLSLDNLIRKGSEVNEKRLKREKITNLRIDVSNSKKIGNLRRFNLIIDCCAEPAIEESKKNFNIILLTANTNGKKLLKQAKEFKVKNLIINKDESLFDPDNKSLKNIKFKRSEYVFSKIRKIWAKLDANHRIVIWKYLNFILKLLEVRPQH